jgi:hypothetical protein
MQNSKLAPQARPHALVDLESRIAEAEKARDHHHGIVSRIVAAGQDSKRARVLLQFAEERLAHLQRSRDVLTGGEDRNDLEAEAEAP